METGLNRKDYELFVRDALDNCIVVGGACPIGCEFCSCRAQAAVGRKNWTNFISEQDLLSIVDYINPNQTIFFGEGPSFLSCEPFQHPNYYRLLELLNLHFPNTKKMTTTVAKGIDPNKYKLLHDSKIKFVVSINTFDRDFRKEFMRSEDDWDSLVNFLKECHNIIEKVSFIHTGDNDKLKRDVDFLKHLHPSYEKKNNLFRLIEYSKHHNEWTKNIHFKSKENWHDAIRIFDKSFDNPDYWIRSLTDFPLDVKESNGAQIYNIHKARINFSSRILDLISYIKNNFINEEDIGFLLPESSYSYFKELYPNLNGILVKNLNFEGSYVVNPLLNLNDYLNAILKEKSYKYYAASKSAFNKYMRDISNNSVKIDYPFKNLLLG